MKFNSVTTLAAIATKSSHAFNCRNSVPPDVVQGFKWTYPFRSNTIASFNPNGESKVSFNALEYTLHDLTRASPNGLNTWAKGLKNIFARREYPGGWAGLDRHLHNRSLLLMDYDKIPLPVRRWIEDEERTDGKGKALFAVFERPKHEKDEIESIVPFPSVDKMDWSEDEQRVTIFSPGALYGILPLWAAGTSKCKDTLSDLDRYKDEPTDGVISWVYPTNIQDHQMQFDIKVQVLERKKTQGKAEEMSVKEEL